MPTYEEMSEQELEHVKRMLEHAQNHNKVPAYIFSYSCPVCCEDVPIGPEDYKIVYCPSCKTKLRIEPDATFEGGCWHDLTRLIPIEDDEHPA